MDFNYDRKGGLSHHHNECLPITAFGDLRSFFTQFIPLWLSSAEPRAQGKRRIYLNFYWNIN